MLATRGCFKKNILYFVYFDLVIASWDSSRLTRTIIRWRPASVSISVHLCQGCIFELLKVLRETYHIKGMKFSFISKKIWNCPGSTPPLAVQNISDRRNNGLSSGIKSTDKKSWFCLLFNCPYRNARVYKWLIYSEYPNWNSKHFSLRLNFSECLKIAHARMNFVEVLDCSNSA